MSWALGQWTSCANLRSQGWGAGGKTSLQRRHDAARLCRQSGRVARMAFRDIHSAFQVCQNNALPLVSSGT